MSAASDFQHKLGCFGTTCSEILHGLILNQELWLWTTAAYKSRLLNLVSGLLELIGTTQEEALLNHIILLLCFLALKLAKRRHLE